MIHVCISIKIGGYGGDSTGNVEFNVGVFQKIKRHRLCLKVSENLSTVLLLSLIHI